MSYDGDNWLNVWQGVGVLAVLLTLALLAMCILSTKHVDYYYVQINGTAGTTGTCAKAHWTWNPDRTAFCSDDYLKVLDFAQKANAVARHGK